MFSSISEELSRRVQKGFGPTDEGLPRGYYLINGGPDVLITIKRVRQRDEAFASNEKAADWVRNNVLEAQGDCPRSWWVMF